MSKEVKLSVSAQDITIGRGGQVIITNPDIFDLIRKEIDVQDLGMATLADDNTGCGNNVYQCSTAAEGSFADFQRQLQDVKKSRLA